MSSEIPFKTVRAVWKFKALSVSALEAFTFYSVGFVGIKGQLFTHLALFIYSHQHQGFN
jgi:hypothetical protein